MTTFFRYDDLSWPEVAALPRDTPLVLPLGEGYPMDRLAGALGNPARAGLLPPFPFGWIGSGLHIEDKLLAAYIRNLLDSLRDDGFSRVYALTPQQIDLGLDSAAIRLPLLTRDASHLTLPPDDAREKVIFFPIGHTEQHGFHLPLSVDTISIEAVCQGAADVIPDQAYCMPVMPYGVSTHRAAFAGTMNAGGRAFEDFWIGVIDALAGRGFKLFYLNSGHGGNSSFLVNIVKYAGERHRRIFCATTFLYLSTPEGVAALEKYRTSPIGGMGHACELETSFLLHLRPDLVHMEKAVDEIDFVATPSYYMDWVEGGALVANPPWDDDTKTGAYGAGTHATAEKGKIWLDVAIHEKIAHVDEIMEQHRRREERRDAGWGLWGKGE